MSLGGIDTEPGMPGLPGVTTTSAVRARTWASACSRPPDPMTQTFTSTPDDLRLALDVLVAPRAHPDEPDGHAHLVLEEGDVVAGVGRKIARLGDRRQVGRPPRQLLGDRR